MAKQRRVLLDSGKFIDYNGPAPERRVISPEKKIAERKELESLATKYGFNPNNPPEGGLSDEDRDLIKTLSEEGVKALFKTRGVDYIDKSNEGEMLVSDGISINDKHAIISGISIPEMKLMARKYNIAIPKTIKKAESIKKYLLDYGSEESSL